MQEVKIQCDCGQRYKFDVEPVNGRMPYAVNCPVCKVDGTAKANEVLRVGGGIALAPAPAPAPAPMPIMAGTAAPGAGSMPPPPPPPVGAGKLRIGGATAAPVAAPMAQPVGARPQPAGGYTVPSVVQGKAPSFWLGVLGALLGMVVGCVLYSLIFYFVYFKWDFRLPYLGIGLGILIGLGARFMGRKEGGVGLGIICSILLVLGIIGSQYIIARIYWQNTVKPEMAKEAASAYDEAVKEAKKAIAEIPNGTDDEIKKHLAKQDVDPGETPDPNSITDEEVKEFRDDNLKDLQALASGETTKEAFDAKARLAGEVSDTVATEIGVIATFIGIFFSIGNFVSLITGGIAAFKVSRAD